MVTPKENWGVPRTSVTGSMLQNPRFNGKNVRLIGNVVKNSGDMVEVSTGDSVHVKVHFQSPLDEPLEGLIDIFGKVVSKNLIEAESYIVVPTNLAENFDLPAHSEAMAFLGSCENPWSQVDL